VKRDELGERGGLGEKDERDELGERAIKCSRWVLKMGSLLLCGLSF
jgi:hypothetical protein